MSKREKSDLLIGQAEDRGERISPIIPNANWIGLDGNFTPDELRAIADRIDDSYSRRKKRNGNPH